MKVEFIANKDKNKPKFKVGDIVAIKEEHNGLKTGKTKYYLLGITNSYYYCLINVKTGEIDDITNHHTLDYEDLTELIKHYNGRVYSGDKVKLVIDKNN